MKIAWLYSFVHSCLSFSLWRCALPSWFRLALEEDSFPDSPDVEESASPFPEEESPLEGGGTRYTPDFPDGIGLEGIADSDAGEAELESGDGEIHGGGRIQWRGYGRWRSGRASRGGRGW